MQQIMMVTAQAVIVKSQIISKIRHQFSNRQLPDIFELYSSVSLLSFAEVSDTGDATGHIRIGTTSSTDSAFAYLPYTASGQPVAVAGDVWLQSTNDSFNDTASLVDGTYWNNVTTHEIGHALGLAHTHEAETIGGTTYGTNTELGSVHNSVIVFRYGLSRVCGGRNITCINSVQTNHINDRRHCSFTIFIWCGHKH